MSVNRTVREGFDALPGAIGAAVRERREELEWSQAFVAQLMTSAGHAWHQTTVAKTERGERPLKLVEAVVLAWVLQVPSLGHLFGAEREAVHNAILTRYTDHIRAAAETSFNETLRRLREIAPAQAAEFEQHMAGVREAIEASGGEASLEDVVAELEKIAPPVAEEGSADG